VFTRDGEDLHCRVTLPMTAAALGTTLELKTLDGEQEIDVRPGTQSGSVITLRAQGAPRLRATGRGDLVVHVEVQTPARLDARQEELLRELAALRGEDAGGASRGDGHGGLFSRVRDAFNGR
jgi:molecular chaperone DnaJ